MHLNIRDVSALSPYRNLVPRFRDEENPRIRIGRGYLNRREEDQDSRDEGNSRSAGSLSFSKRVPKIYMMSCSQGREGTPSEGANYRAERSFIAWSETPCTQSTRRKVGVCMTIDASRDNVLEHHMDKVMIMFVGPREYQWYQVRL
jgi:hypothetical protein